MVEAGSALSVDVGEPGGIKPGAPVDHHHVVQQALVREVGQRPKRLRAIEQLRRADRKHTLGQKPSCLDVGPVAFAVADVDVHGACQQHVGVEIRGREADIDLGIRLDEAPEARQQPQRQERVERADPDDPAPAPVHHGAGGGPDRIEGGADAWQVRAARLG